MKDLQELLYRTRSRDVEGFEYQIAESSLTGAFRKLQSEIDDDIDRLLMEMSETRGWFTKEGVEKKEHVKGEHLNELDIITYKFGISETKTKGKFEKGKGEKFVGYFKAKVEETKGEMGIKKGIPEMFPAEHRRTLAMYELDKALGADVILPTFLAKHGGKMGTVMAKVEGMTETLAKTEEPEVLKKSDFKRSLSKLFLLDIIAGQVDRHKGNYLLEIKDKAVKGVKGIDLDMAFGEKYTGADVEDYNKSIAKAQEKLKGNVYAQRQGSDEIGQIRESVRGRLPVELEEIDQEFAKTIINTAEKGTQKIKDALAGLLPKAEIEATFDRLRSLAKILVPLIGKEEQELVITESK
jgi:hypothetical protein